MKRLKLKIKHQNLHWKIAFLVLVLIVILLSTVLVGKIFENKIIEKKELINERMYDAINYNNIEIDFDIENLSSERLLIGDDDANLTIVIYGDFECPFSKKFYKKTYKTLKEDYVDTGKANLLFISFPAIKFHKYSLIESEAYECFREQNKSQEIIDKLFYSKFKTKEEIIDFALNVTDINATEFLDCYDGERYHDDLLYNIQKAHEMGIKITPTVIIGNQKIEGAKPYVIYKNAVIRALGE